MSCYGEMMTVAAVALLLHACVSPPPLAPSSLAIGLGQERLHLGMTVSEAMTANQELFFWAPKSDRSAWLALPFNYRWENCRFLVSIYFFDDMLAEADFEATGDVDACEASILQKFPVQYGPAQQSEPAFTHTIYMVKNPAREIDVIDFGPAGDVVRSAGVDYIGKGKRSAFGGPPPADRYFGVVFLKPNGPIILTQ